MITTLSILLLALFVMVLLVRAARGRAQLIANIEKLPDYTQPLDLPAFRNLVSRHDEQYLRENLSYGEYRRVQRLRLRSALEYVRRATNNAAVLVRLGESARRNADPAVASAAQELIVLA